MSRAVNDIAQRLSLRTPQREALDRLASLVERRGGEPEVLPLVRRVPRAPGESTPPPPDAPDLSGAEARVAAAAPGFSSFERDFPSLCFALATGVGKTRLMGAFMAYLFREHGVRHFFVLAPNLTIYQKLKRDFSPGTPQYVLTGLSEFATHPPKLVHGENYETSQLHRYRADRGLFDEVHINVFNISKFNRDATTGKTGTARMRRLSETLGESYFDYLRSLPDLVLMMDESHRYRGDAGVKALNELRPMLGLELGVRQNYAEQARLEDYVLRVLDSRSEVDYKRNAPLLQKLATDLVAHVREEQRGAPERGRQNLRLFQPLLFGERLHERHHALHRRRDGLRIGGRRSLLGHGGVRLRGKRAGGQGEGSAGREPWGRHARISESSMCSTSMKRAMCLVVSSSSGVRRIGLNFFSLLTGDRRAPAAVRSQRLNVKPPKCGSSGSSRRTTTYSPDAAAGTLVAPMCCQRHQAPSGATRFMELPTTLATNRPGRLAFLDSRCT